MTTTLNAKLKSLEERIKKLEKNVFVNTFASAQTLSKPKKQITITALARKGNIKNGQQKIAVIVGYYEKVLGKNSVTESEIKEGWKDGKFTGNYANVLLQRAIKYVLIRDLRNGVYDLTQEGEDYFQSILIPNEKG